MYTWCPIHNMQMYSLDVPYTIYKYVHMKFYTPLTNVYKWCFIRNIQMCTHDVPYTTYKCVHMMFHMQHTNVCTWCSIHNIQMCTHDVPYATYKCVHMMFHTQYTNAHPAYQPSCYPVCMCIMYGTVLESIKITMVITKASMTN